MCALAKQSPYWLRVARGKSFTKSPNDIVLAAFATVSESISVLWGLSHGQENDGVAYREGKSDTPCQYAFLAGDHLVTIRRFASVSKLSSVITLGNKTSKTVDAIWIEFSASPDAT
jgi:hypothetical protein